MTSAAESIVNFYRRHAARFDAERGRGRMEEGWLDRFLALAEPGGRILDIGCGSGEPIARYIVDRGFAVTGVDSSPAMLDLCRRRFPQQDWICADMRTFSLGRRFDAALAWDSFFHLARDAQRAMFPVFAAHAAPGAPLMFTSGPSEGEAVGSMFGEPLFHASLGEAEYRALLDANGFDVIAYAPEDPTCGRHTIWLARKRT